jgi:2-polyprenyl-3-methyl-5-hydroxy-6-metoxy-1,4-benzoquinol methylase
MRPYLITKDYFKTKEPFTLFEDTEKEMLLTQPVPKDLTSYYDNTNYISHTDQPKTLTDRLYFLVKKITLQNKRKLIQQLSVPHKKLLDIGAGTGDFLNIMIKNDWEVSGIEPNSKARNLAAKKNIYLQENLESFDDNNFSVITLWHVLEHLPNLNESIKTITSLLANQGYLIIAVPNYKSFDAQHYKEYWAAYDTPRHLYHFSTKSISILFEPLGFQLLEIKPMIFDAFYVALLSEKYKTGKTRYLTAFLIGLLSNIKGLRSHEYSSHIYILKKTNS